MKTDEKHDEPKNLSKEACDIENFKMVAEHFNQDLREYWNRANFYLLTNAGLFSAFLVIYPTLIIDNLFLVCLVPVVGISIAILWYMVMRGSLFWIDKWRKEMIQLSKEIDRFQCFARIEAEHAEKKASSPSHLTQVMPLIFLIAWIVILAFIALGIMFSSGGVRWIPTWNSTAT